jgi:hypothetical protein
LHLGRVSRWLRAIVFSERHALPAWKLAFESCDDLPAVPLGCAHPKWTALLFEDACFECGKKTSRACFWLRLRLCATCATSRITASDWWPNLASATLAKRFIVMTNDEHPQKRVWSKTKTEGEDKTKRASVDGYFDINDLMAAKKLIEDWEPEEEKDVDYLARRPDLQQRIAFIDQINSEAPDAIDDTLAWFKVKKDAHMQQRRARSDERIAYISDQLKDLGIELDKLPEEVCRPAILDGY